MRGGSEMRGGAKKAKKIVAIDFFCGAGGVTRGLRDAKIQVVAGIDIEEDFEKTYTSNNPGSKYINKNISAVSRYELEELLAPLNYDHLMFSGCAPCQPFSSCYKGESESDERSSVLAHFGRLIQELKPDFVFTENVPGILKICEGKPIKDFVSTLEKNRYRIAAGVVNAKWYGIPQERRRLILIGSRMAVQPSLPQATHGPGLEPYSTVKDTIKGYSRLRAGGKSRVFHNHECSELASTNLERIRATPKDGGSWEDWPARLLLECHKKEDAGHSDVYGRMRWDTPSPTLTCRCYSISNGRFGHPSQDRAISFREAAALQTFPDNYIFYGRSKKSLGMQIGNAVPVSLAKLIGEQVVKMSGGFVDTLSAGSP